MNVENCSACQGVQFCSIPNNVLLIKKLCFQWLLRKISEAVSSFVYNIILYSTKTDTIKRENVLDIIIIIIIFQCYFSREHIALSYKKRCGNRIRKNQQIKSTARDGKSYLK